MYSKQAKQEKILFQIASDCDPTVAPRLLGKSRLPGFNGFEFPGTTRDSLLAFGGHFHPLHYCSIIFDFVEMLRT